MHKQFIRYKQVSEETQQLTKHGCWLIAHVCLFHQIVWIDHPRWCFVYLDSSHVKWTIVAGLPDLQWFVETFCRFVFREKDFCSRKKHHLIPSRSLSGCGANSWIFCCFVPKSTFWTLHPTEENLQDSYKTTQTHDPYLTHTAIRSLDAQAWTMFFLRVVCGKVKCKTARPHYIICLLDFRLNKF